MKYRSIETRLNLIALFCSFALRFWIFVSFALACAAAPVWAQGDPRPVPTGTCAGGGKPAGPCKSNDSSNASGGDRNSSSSSGSAKTDPGTQTLKTKYDWAPQSNSAPSVPQYTQAYIDKTFPAKPSGPVPRLTWLIIPCVDDLTPCGALVEATDLINKMEHTPNTDDSDLVNDWIHQLGSVRYILLHFNSQHDEEEAHRSIRKLNEEAIVIVRNTLSEQIARLQPFEWDTPETAALKRQAVTEHGAELEKMIEDIRAPRYVVPLTSGREKLYFGESFKKLIQINESGSWSHL